MQRSSRPPGSDEPRTIDYVPKEELDRALEENERLQRQIERLKQENERLRRELEAALRASKRQAAPHSRGKPKDDAKKPGRKKGHQQATRPTPSHVDEEIKVPLPEHCPHCGGDVEHEGWETQFQEEIVRRKIVRRFDIEMGSCRRCGRRVQGRDAAQTSDAVRVGKVQLGPEALALAAILNKQMGLSLERTQQALAYGFGLMVSRAGLYRALARMARRAEPTYQSLVKVARQSRYNCADETGWKVGGWLQWLHVAVSEEVTVYAIRPGRGYEQMIVILGRDYAGFLIHDGYASYYQFQFCFHQTCLNHLLARCAKMIEIASPSAAAFPLAIQALLETSLDLRDRYEQGEISERGLRIAQGRLEAQLDRTLDTTCRNEANRRLENHLDHERPWLFSFLDCPGLDATNHQAEIALRPMVVTRKVWGGNRTWAGAHTQEVMLSVLRTCWQQDKDPFPRLVSLLHAPRTMLLDLVPGGEAVRGPPLLPSGSPL